MWVVVPVATFILSVFSCLNWFPASALIPHTSIRWLSAWKSQSITCVPTSPVSDIPLWTAWSCVGPRSPPHVPLSSFCWVKCSDCPRSSSLQWLDLSYARVFDFIHSTVSIPQHAGRIKKATQSANKIHFMTIERGGAWSAKNVYEALRWRLLFAFPRGFFLHQRNHFIGYSNKFNTTSPNKTLLHLPKLVAILHTARESIIYTGRWLRQKSWSLGANANSSTSQCAPSVRWRFRRFWVPPTKTHGCGSR